jgi:hypothetical protein
MLRYLFILTALLESLTALALLVLPAVSLALLLDVAAEAPPAVFFVSRVAGAALLALGSASWLARNDENSPARFGLLVGILVYDVVVAALLAYAGLALSMAGIALWPAVALHTGLALWCVVCLRSQKIRSYWTKVQLPSSTPLLTIPPRTLSANRCRWRCELSVAGPLQTGRPILFMRGIRNMVFLTTEEADR